MSTFTDTLFSLASTIPKTLDLSLAPLLILADLKIIPERTIITGSSSLLDILILCPGLHNQAAADQAHHGEYPATAAMTTGYVFRTENQAMVRYLQCVGKAGALVTLKVQAKQQHPWSRLRESIFGPSISLPYLIVPVLTVGAIIGLATIQDFWALTFLLMLMFSRSLNVLVIRHRLAPEWKGAGEPGVMGDLLVLLSQDRWVRIQGLVDDLKAISSGQWVRDASYAEEFMAECAKVLVYLGILVGVKASHTGGFIVLLLLLISSILLGVSNRAIRGDLHMHGRIVSAQGKPKDYERRRALVDELIKEHGGRDDWAVGMGMIRPKDRSVGVVIM